ncbi:MAG: hypothetical protein M9894_17965 [Planctomycetes bacterium]|nr:hypothetical protein [Planctomycetota bacterium]
MRRTLTLAPLLLAALAAAAHAQEVPFRTVGRGDGADAVGPAGGDYVIRSRADLERLDLAEFVHEEIAWGKRLLLASTRDARPDGRAHRVEIRKVERVPGAPRLIVEVETWVPTGRPQRGTGERPVHIIEVAIDPGVHVEFRARAKEPVAQAPAAQVRQARPTRGLAGELTGQATPALPTLHRFEYRRILEWDGDHLDAALKLVRQPDGSYLADVNGRAPLRARSGVVVAEAALADLRAALAAMEGFPTHSFAGDGNHYADEVRAEGVHADGRPYRFARSFYDPGEPRWADLAAALDEAVARLAKQVAR